MSDQENDTNLISNNEAGTSISDIMQSAYIDYSMSVIVSRALPDARDGLKPVQRRILYAMLREGLLHNRPFDKCAGVVGEVLKNYHPHGDSSVYDTLVRLAQKWVMRYPLIIPQGNFGSIDGDSAAAYRYTECKLENIAEDLLKDIDEDTVNFVPNYKESITEPSVLPAALPNLLMNGSTGIAVGMTTNIPPHNLNELIDASCAIIDNPHIDLDSLIELIPGPDFPGGGFIHGKSGIESYLKTGRGIVRTRGIADVIETNGKEEIIISAIPYNVNRASLVMRIAELITTKAIDGISDLRDESTEETRIVIELKRGAIPRVIVNQLYKMTPLESSFGVILLALDNRRPKQMNIKEMLNCYIDHRRDVIYRRTEFRLKKAEARAHILEGYRIALDNLDDFVKLIRASKNREEAKNKLKEKYPVSEAQINAILELRLYQLTGLERDKIEDEYLKLMTEIEELKSILNNEQELLNVIKDELLVMKEKYGNPRRSEILNIDGDISMEDLIPNEGCMITVSHKGFIKRTTLDAYRSQKRGGKGVIGSGQYEDDFVEHLFTASTHDYIMCFMNSGRVYVEKVYHFPEGSRTAKGRSISNILEIQETEKIAAMICVKGFDETNESIVLATKNGVVKKTKLSDFRNFRKGGIIGINIDDNDDLIGARLTQGEDEIVLITQNAQSIRFAETQLRDQGRATRGVRGIKLKSDSDEVVAIEIVNPEATLLAAGANGLGKRTSFDDYRQQSRGGTGIIAMKTEKIAGVLSVVDSDEIMMFTKNGQAVRSPIKDVRISGRATSGVKLVNLTDKDTLIGISKVVMTEEEATD
ncbi:MAG: DNA gyrase subunit A [Puniceicoccaceae bacterium MED-G32]|jgi:DNA gyrase subunit A|nr:DNA gyrase subunit A [Puniceicoccaceae bacterium]PDH26292.1 MAG: DNA gyrase subunit A [Puniceicoccaceae bacterium MED-G32]CAI8332567.1 MAG: DNA gyrase subunit A [Puniceicoccaceae bacterium MED-G32]|tara:strand:+ start:10019 stop:12469 length:2451 start_codon:yes stop_codon:yes gene_type:complete